MIAEIKIKEPFDLYLASAWKKSSDVLFTPEHSVQVWQNLQNNGMIPALDKDLVCVSPTANIATHERAIWEYDRDSRSGRSLFLVGDLDRIDYTKIQKPNFQCFRWDAEWLPLNFESVDVIWDRKGFLWYPASSHNKASLKTTFYDYFVILKQGGCIVIDAIEGFRNYERSLPKDEKNKIIEMRRLYNAREVTYADYLAAYLNPPGQYEQSTDGLIKETGFDILKYFPHEYEEHFIGEGLTRVSVIVKR